MKSRLSAATTTECVFVSQDPSKSLRELCDKSRIANDEHELLNAVSENTRRDFELLQQTYWSVDAATVFRWLRRCQFRTESIQSVDEAINDHGRHLLRGDPNIYESLSNYLVGNFNKLITTEVARRWILEESPYSFRPTALDQTLVEAIQQANSRYLQSYLPFGFGGEGIQRQQTSEALSALQADDAPSLVLLTGAAGSGKSGVVRELMAKLKAQKVPHLAFRIDRYLDTQTKRQIGSVLLDCDDSPISGLANLAQNGPGVLIIDQIDAVSEISGRTGAIKDVLFDLVREAQRYADVRCILVCRTFDFENDPQYRHLKQEHQATTIEVPHLDWEKEVAPVLEKSGFDPGQFNDRQRDLLMLPINLSIFLEIRDPALPFDTGGTLMQALLTKKQRDLQASRNVPWSLLEPLAKMAEWMSDKQELICPDTVLDALSGATAWLESHGLITSHDNRLAFFHESFFDFVFARTFVGSDRDIGKFLTSSEQYLFRRTQVRQILTLMRDTDRARYLESLETVLVNRKIRLHVQVAAAQWLASVSDPTVEELSVIQKLDRFSFDFQALRQSIFSLRKVVRCPVKHDSPYPFLMRRALFESDAWFDLLYSTGELSSVLRAASQQRQSTLLWWFNRIVDKFPQPIAKLLREWWEREPARNTQLCYWFCRLRSLPDDPAIAVLLRDLIRATPDSIFSEGDRISALRLLPDLCVKYPKIVADILRISVDQYFARNPGSHPFGFTPNQSLSVRHLSKIAEKSPASFLDGMIPALLNSIRMSSGDSGADSIHVLYRARHDGGAAALFSLYRHALCSLALGNPLDAECRLDELDPTLHEVLIHLHLEAIAANPAHLGHRLTPLLDLERLFLAGMEGVPWLSFAAAARSVIEDQQQSSTLIEDTILRHFPELDHAVKLLRQSGAERGTTRGPQRNSALKWLARSGHIQWCVLKSIGPDLLSARGKERLAELDRKFFCEEVPTPRMYEARRVESSIPDTATEKMTDSQWLSAIYDFERRDADPEHSIINHLGVASAFQQQLARAAKDDPDRFALFFFKLPQDVSLQYALHVLQGLANADNVDIGAMTAVLKAAHAYPDRPFGLEICRILRRHTACADDDGIFHALLWYAEHGDASEGISSDSAADQENRFLSIDALVQSNSMLVINGINCARGAAWELLGKLIRSSPHRAEDIWSLIERRVPVESRAPIRAVFPYVLIPLAAFDRRRFESCLRLLVEPRGRDRSNPSSLAPLSTHLGIELFFPIEQEHPDLALQLMRRLLKSRNRNLELIGAWWSMCERLRVGNSRRRFPWLHRRSPAHTVLWASILCAFAPHTEYRRLATRQLSRLFFHRVPEVRRAASGVFDNISGDEFVHFKGLAQKFLRSPAFRDSSQPIIGAMEHATCDVTDLVLVTAERIVRNRNRKSQSIFELRPILKREYANSLNRPAVHSRYLNLLDEMVAIDFPEADELMRLGDRSSV